MELKIGIWSTAIILALGLAGCGVAQTSHHTTLHSVARRVKPLELNQITMLSAKNGWALSPKGVVTTTDGGSKWILRGPKTLSTESVLSSLTAAFPAPNNAILVHEDTSTIKIWRTNDRGIHWHSEILRPPESVIQNNLGGNIQVQFVSAHIGIIVLSSQDNAGSLSDALLQTTDGGAHWQLLQKSSAGSLFEDIGRITMSPTGGGIASINSMVAGRATTLITDNRGRSWTSSPLPLPGVSIYDQVLEGTPEYQGGSSYSIWVSLFNNHTGQRRWLFEHTINGGERWTAIPGSHAVPPINTITGLTLWPLPHKTLLFVNDSQGTEIYEQTDNNLGWHAVSRLPIQQTESVALLANGDGWIIGKNGNYRTTNGGLTWEEFSPYLN